MYTHRVQRGLFNLLPLFSERSSSIVSKLLSFFFPFLSFFLSLFIYLFIFSALFRFKNTVSRAFTLPVGWVPAINSQQRVLKGIRCRVELIEILPTAASSLVGSFRGGTAGFAPTLPRESSSGMGEALCKRAG